MQVVSNYLSPRQSLLVAKLNRLFFGNPLPSSASLEHRLPIGLALPVFASDAISSVAYSTQEILMVLGSVTLVGGVSALGYQLWVSVAIAALMFIVATSYRRAVILYPTSGGSYTVSKSNLGALAGLIAAAALLIDYVMTVAVSISSGVDALTSAYPHLTYIHIEIAVVLVGVITLANLRGTKESGWVFALPLYSFITLAGIMVLTTVVRYALHGGHMPEVMGANATSAAFRLPNNLVVPKAGAMLGLFVLLRAFSNGCSAMTGVEAVSNGVSAFKPPEAQNAAKTLAILLGTLMFLFLGIGFAAQVYGARPSDTETILSMVTRATFGINWVYYATQFSTLALLMVAANTSFADFPRLTAFVARDNFAPKAFIQQGDRLVYHRGIMALAIISALLIIVFKANVTKLIGLYSIGVFLCFTLTQLGMAKRIKEMGEKGWQRGVITNIIGALVTGAVTMVVMISKFGEGAWMVLVLIPIVIAVCYAIHMHYMWFDRIMAVEANATNPLTDPPDPVLVLVLISSDIHRGNLEGLAAARDLAAGNPDSEVRAVHIEMDPEKTHRLHTRWEQLVEPNVGKKIQLDIVPSPYRWLTEPILSYLDSIETTIGMRRIVVVLPEFETGNPLTHFLHNFTARRLRSALLNRPNITVVSSRYFMKPMAWRKGRNGLVF